MATLQEIESAPAVMSLRRCITLIGISRAEGYALARAGRFPVPLIYVGDKAKVSKYDLLAYLHAPEPVLKVAAAS